MWHARSTPPLFFARPLHPSPPPYQEALYFNTELQALQRQHAALQEQVAATDALRSGVVQPPSVPSNMPSQHSAHASAELNLTQRSVPELNVTHASAASAAASLQATQVHAGASLAATQVHSAAPSNPPSAAAASAAPSAPAAPAPSPAQSSSAPPAPAPAPAAQVAATPAVASNAAKPPLGLPKVGGLGGLAVLLLLCLYLAATTGGSGEVKKPVALAALGDPAGVLHVEEAAADALYNATAERIATTLEGGHWALLGELVETGHAVNPPKGWRAVAAVCRGVDGAFPNSGRTEEEAQKLVSEVCWDCLEVTSFGLPFFSVFCTLVVLAATTLGVLGFVRMTAMQKAQARLRDRKEGQDSAELDGVSPTIMCPEGHQVTRVWASKVDDDVGRLGLQSYEVALEFNNCGVETPVDLPSALAGKVSDVRTLKLTYEQGVLREVCFDGCYAGTHCLTDTAPNATTSIVPASCLQVGQGGRAVLHVNTVDHLLSERRLPGVAYNVCDLQPIAASVEELQGAFRGVLSA